MRNKRIVLAAGALVAIGAIPALGSSGPTPGTEEERDVPISGNDLDRAVAAALAHVGEGKVTGTEVGDEESLYEVEITLVDGSQVDVQLDEGFTVVGMEPEGPGED